MLPTAYGDFRAVKYRTLIDAKEHQAFVMGDVATDEPVLARCTTSASPAMSSARCAATAANS